MQIVILIFLLILGHGTIDVSVHESTPDLYDWKAPSVLYGLPKLAPRVMKNQLPWNHEQSTDESSQFSSSRNNSRQKRLSGKLQWAFYTTAQKSSNVVVIN